MQSEAYRPTYFDDIVGHVEIKVELEKYLKLEKFNGCIMLVGSPGIGKTTLALCAANTFEFDPLEINASKSIRSFEDVAKYRDSCRAAVNIKSFLCGNTSRKTCVILDEVDGSDPHAQNKIVEWINDPTRSVPIICTGNEIPTVFKRNYNSIKILRCFPPNPLDLKQLFPDIDIEPILVECQHDIRRVFHRLQYGKSDTIATYLVPPTGSPIENQFVWRQAMFALDDPYECLYDKLDNARLLRTKFEYNFHDKHDCKVVEKPRRKLHRPDK